MNYKCIKSHGSYNNDQIIDADEYNSLPAWALQCFIPIDESISNDSNSSETESSNDSSSDDDSILSPTNPLNEILTVGFDSTPSFDSGSSDSFGGFGGGDSAGGGASGDY